MFKNAIQCFRPLVNQVRRSFTIIPAKFAKEAKWNTENALHHYALKMRKIALDRTILDKEKIIVPVKRIRTEQDTLAYLRERNECAGVINARDEFEDVDVVFDATQIFALRRRKDAVTQSYYIDLNGERIRVTFESLMIHYIHGWIIHAKFDRYIVGRPNLIYLPFYVKQTMNNKYINTMAHLRLRIKGAWVYCYNENYPTGFEIDTDNLTTRMGYRLGDLQDQLPPGIELHKKHKIELNRHIIELASTKRIQTESDLKELEIQRRIRAGEDILDIVEEEEAEERRREEEALNANEEKERARMGLDPVKKEMPKRERRRKQVKSLKKQVQAMNVQVRDDLGLTIGTQESKKKGH